MRRTSLRPRARLGGLWIAAGLAVAALPSASALAQEAGAAGAPPAGAPRPSSAAGCVRCTEVGDAPDALPGLLDVPVATLRPTLGGAIVVSGALGGSWDEPWPGSTRVRALGAIAGAIHPIEWLAIAASVSGRWDEVDPGDGTGADSGGASLPSVTVRLTTEPAEGLGLALDASVWMFGSDAPSLEPASTSLRARAVGSYRVRLAPSASLTTSLAIGGLLDNSRGAAPQAFTDALSPADRLSLGVSDFSSVLAGLGASLRIGSVEVIAEVAYRALVGSGAPDPGASPLHLAAGARWRPLGELLELGAIADVLASGVDGRFVAAGAPAAPIDPRITVLLTIAVRLGWGADEPVAAEGGAGAGGAGAGGGAGAAAGEGVGASHAGGRLEGQVVDEGGAPVAGARVEVFASDAPDRAREAITDERGVWSVEGLPPGPARVVVHREGREPVEVRVEVRDDAAVVVPLALGASLPQGEIRGTVQGADGRPLAGASVRILPADVDRTTDEDGGFEVEVPPGRYTVEVRAPGHRSQTREVVVEERGVVLLNAQLHRAR